MIKVTCRSNAMKWSDEFLRDTSKSPKIVNLVSLDIWGL